MDCTEKEKKKKKAKAKERWKTKEKENGKDLVTEKEERKKDRVKE